MIRARQRQHLFGLSPASPLRPTQAVEEPHRHVAQFTEPLLQRLLTTLPVAGRTMAFLLAFLPGRRDGEQEVPGDLVDLRAVHDQLVFADLHRQHLTRTRRLPGDRVAVATPAHKAFYVDGAVDHLGHFVSVRRQRNQMRLFLGVAVDRPLARGAMHSHVGHVLQPPGRDLVEVFQRTEFAAVQQALLDVIELPFDFAFRLRAPHAAGPGSESVVGGEGQKPRVVNRLAVLDPHDHRLHIVVQVRGCHALEMLERPDVLAQRRFHVLPFGELQVLIPRIAQHAAEQVHLAAAFASKVDRVRGPIHLTLHSGPGFKPLNDRRRFAFPQRRHPFAENAVAAVVAFAAELFQNALDGNVGIAAQQPADLVFVSIDLAGTPLARLGCGSRVPLAVAAMLVDGPFDGLTGYVQVDGDATHRLPFVPAANDFVASEVVHASSSFMVRVPSWFEFLQKIPAAFGNGLTLLDQPLQGLPQQRPIDGGQFAASPLHQPGFHAGQAVQQESQLLVDAVAGRTEPRIVRPYRGTFRLADRLPGLFQHEVLFLSRAGGQQQIDHRLQLAAGQRFAAGGLQSLDLVAARQPHQLARRSGREQAQSQIVLAFFAQLLQQSQPPTDPTLVPPQQRRHRHLRQTVLMNQGLHDPGFFQFLRRAADEVQPIDGGLGLLLVDLQTAGRERREAAQRAGRSQAFETVDQHVRLVELANDDRGKLTVAQQRGGHLFLVGRRDQAVAAEAFVKGFQVQRANFMGWPSHGVLPGWWSCQVGGLARLQKEAGTGTHTHVLGGLHRASLMEPVPLGRWGRASPVEVAAIWTLRG